MKYTSIPLIFLLTVALMIPVNHVHADKWYHSGWVIGGAGLLVGTVIGASIADSGRSSRHVRTYETRPVYVQESSSRWVTSTYVEETRVWPFYRRTRLYPVIGRSSYDHEATSMAWRLREGYSQQSSQHGQSAGQKAGVEINVGDNNQNVNISVSTDDKGERREIRYRTVTIPNDATGSTNRMIDLKVPEGEEVEKPAATRKVDEKKSDKADEKTE
ncbi:MAG: hypothetical protein JJU11_00930 [Candidatus Sumerlaeia bacterium]|nr:hypothetical protein [Candidatus Sumerlaeia bacterium]